MLDTHAELVRFAGDLALILADPSVMCVVLLMHGSPYMLQDGELTLTHTIRLEAEGVESGQQVVLDANASAQDPRRVLSVGHGVSVELHGLRLFHKEVNARYAKSSCVELAFIQWRWRP